MIDIPFIQIQINIVLETSVFDNWLDLFGCGVANDQSHFKDNHT